MQDTRTLALVHGRACGNTHESSQLSVGANLEAPKDAKPWNRSKGKPHSTECRVGFFTS
ncbi:MAG: hypothetical protein KGI27_08555 [Thaumarchaeota archaeon]|nr:hypothetical protein [Nitrososphaerota archaeon]